ncbi:MAG: hypothetical protein JNL51_12285 [Chitinophagaceae bacterium]|nr:hypothetical protein [Chitinophagaceae bacterium]
MRSFEIKKRCRPKGKRRHLWVDKKLIPGRLPAALLAAGIFIWTNVSAQFDSRNSNYFDSPWEIFAGVSPGAMNCLTDIGGREGRGSAFIKDLRLRNSQPAAGIHLGIRRNDILWMRLEINRGSLSGEDSILQQAAPGSYGRYTRNLHFRTVITEALLIGECYLLNLFALRKNSLQRAEENGQTERAPAFVHPYFLGGIGLFHFNPRAMLGGAWFFLHEFHTEGQGFKEYKGRKNYSLLQCHIPIGLGLRFRISQKWNAGFELVYRLLFTDYLDDTSASYIDPENFYKNFPPQKAAIAEALADRRKRGNSSPTATTIRGNPSKNDAYLSAMLKVNMNLRSD